MKKKNIVSVGLFFLVLFLIGVIVGLLFYYKQEESIRNNIISSLSNFKKEIITNQVSNLGAHFIIILMLFGLSITGIGLIGCLFYLFYEGLAMGFGFGVMYACFKVKGIIFNLLYQATFKGLYLFFIVVLLIRLLRISKYIIGYLIYRQNLHLIINELKKSLLISLFIFLNDILLLVLSKYILLIITFVL